VKRRVSDAPVSAWSYAATQPRPVRKTSHAKGPSSTADRLRGHEASTASYLGLISSSRTHNATGPLQHAPLKRGT